MFLCIPYYYLNFKVNKLVFYIIRVLINSVKYNCNTYCLKFGVISVKFSTEIAFDFDGSEAIIFKKKYGIFSEPFEISFAFSLSEAGRHSNETEILLLLRDVLDEDELYSHDKR